MLSKTGIVRRTCCMRQYPVFAARGVAPFAVLRRERRKYSRYGQLVQHLANHMLRTKVFGFRLERDHEPVT